MRIIAFIIFILIALQAEGKISSDTTVAYQQSLDKSEWEKQTKDLNYPGTKTIVKNNNQKKTPVSLPWLKYLIYAVISIFLVYLIVRLLRMKGDKKIEERKTEVQSGEAAEEFILNAPYEKFFIEAVMAGNFRLAIRFAYLLSLQELGARKLITISRDKTNYEYLRELTTHPLAGRFREITGIFEKTWYGEMEIHQPEFVIFEEKFRHFREQMKL